MKLLEATLDNCRAAHRLLVYALLLLGGLILVPLDVHAQTKNGFVSSGDRQIYYEEQGTGQPLVLIHGGGLTHLMWQNFAASASAKYRIIALDSRGHGHSTNPGDQFSYVSMADDVVELINQLKLQKPILVGYSDGGIIALTLAARHPELLRAIIVCGADSNVADSKHYFDGMETFFLTRSQGQISDAELDRLAQLQPDMVRRFAKIHRDWRLLLKAAWPMWTTPYVIPPAMLARIDLPTLIVVGDRDEFFSVESATRLYRALPKSELGIVPDGTHTLFRDKHGLFEDLVLNFVQRQQSAK